jgi:hypothetical protein
LRLTSVFLFLAVQPTGADFASKITARAEEGKRGFRRKTAQWHLATGTFFLKVGKLR